MKIRHREPYAPLRAREYPGMGDQLDAVFKLAQALRDQGTVLPDDVLAWVDQCERVKAKYPKK